jgi:crossover junction endodeoxyribonuclease RuvC
VNTFIIQHQGLSILSVVRPRILGIDPGSRVIGFALIEGLKARPLGPRDWAVMDVGVMKASAGLELTARLGEIHCGLYDVIAQTAPTIVAIEKAFHGANASTAIKLGEARGALIAAIMRHNLPLHEITPAEVKRLIAGHGAADKEQVYKALKSILGFDRGCLPFDASDALGIALASSLRMDAKAVLPISTSKAQYRQPARSSRT